MASTTINYTALRRLRSGVNAGDPEEITLELVDFSRSVNKNVTKSVAIDGTQEHVLHSIYDKWTIRTIPISGSSREQIDEFLYSCAAGENFVMTIPDEDDRLISAKIQGNHSRNRFNISKLDEFQYSFTVQEF